MINKLCVSEQQTFRPLFLHRVLFLPFSFSSKSCDLLFLLCPVLYFFIHLFLPAPSPLPVSLLCLSILDSQRGRVTLRGSTSFSLLLSIHFSLSVSLSPALESLKLWLNNFLDTNENVASWISSHFRSTLRGSFCVFLDSLWSGLRRFLCVCVLLSDLSVAYTIFSHNQLGSKKDLTRSCILVSMVTQHSQSLWRTEDYRWTSSKTQKTKVL